MRIDIYMDSDARGTQTKNYGHTWYIMESIYKGKPISRKKSITWMEHNRNGAIVEGLLYALTQIKAAGAEVCLYTENVYTAGRFSPDQIREWDISGYRNKDGTKIKYRELWSKIGDIVISQSLNIVSMDKIPEEKKEEIFTIGEKLKHA